MGRHRRDGLSKICDCPERARLKCEHTWHFALQHRGKRYRFSLDRHLGRHVGTKTEARQIAEELRSKIRRGELGDTPASPTADATTLEAFSKIYVERVAKLKEGRFGWKDDIYMLNRICAFVPPGSTQNLGKTPIGAITDDSIESFYAHLHHEGRANSTRNHYVQTLRNVFRFAQRKHYIHHDPTIHLKRTKPAQRSRRLSVGEEERLLAVANPRLQRVIIGLLETGARYQELTSATWADVSLERRELTLRAENTKTRQARVLPISDRLVAVLEMCRTDPAGRPHPLAAFVFGNEIGARVVSVRTAWRNACRKAKVSGLRLHDLRHEAGSRFIEAGFPLHHVQAMLGHANLKTTSTYLNATLSGLHTSMQRWDEQRQGAKEVPNSPQTNAGYLGKDSSPAREKSLLN